jgi:ribonuclease Z
MMECFILGSGGMMPMPRRRLTSVALRTGGWVYLLDCGEGTQVPYKALHVGQRGLRLVAVTHLHADHCLGLPGMLMLRAQMPDPGPLVVVGPPGLGRFIQHVREDLALYINYPIEVRERTGGPGVVYEDEGVRLYARPVEHSVLCLGYRLEERERPGKFDIERADRLGVPNGPLRGRLQRGEAITTPEGVRVDPSQVMGPPRRGRHVAFITDTAPCQNLQPLLEGTDLAFLESMFLPEHRDEAEAKRHLTADQAASAAARAKVAELILVHVSPRYEENDLALMAEEASRHHPRARVAKEGERVLVALPDR